MFNFDKMKAMLCKRNMMELLKLLKEYIIFGHGTGQLAGSGWKKEHELQYHQYPIHKDVELKDAVVFAYGAYKYRNVGDKCKVLLGDVDPLYIFDEEKGADNNVFRNRIYVEMTEEGDRNSVMDVRPDDSTDAPVKPDYDRKSAQPGFQVCLYDLFWWTSFLKYFL